ncbi:hypothetical protein PUN28_003942 [Cardiocondyla obscurior]|uniref:Uncharacterized protein n=1 Tax=Cardiocondyla obscurior TaxID=286306 RepID=A0AAW2GMN0_9HYME
MWDTQSIFFSKFSFVFSNVHEDSHSLINYLLNIAVYCASRRDYMALISRRRPQFNLQLPDNFRPNFSSFCRPSCANREPNYPTRNVLTLSSLEEVSGVLAPPMESVARQVSRSMMVFARGFSLFPTILSPVPRFGPRVSSQWMETADYSVTKLECVKYVEKLSKKDTSADVVKLTKSQFTFVARHFVCIKYLRDNISRYIYRYKQLL